MAVAPGPTSTGPAPSGSKTTLDCGCDPLVAGALPELAALRVGSDLADRGVETDAAYQALAQFFCQAPIGLIRADADGDIALMNPMSRHLLEPLAPDGNMGNLFHILAQALPDLRDRVAAFAHPQGTVCDALRIPVDPGAVTSRPLALSFTLVKLGGSELMASVGDATADVLRERRQLAHELDEASRIDSLTTLPNCSVVINRLDHAIRSSSRCGSLFAVLFINCDRFKRVNEAYGRSVGDNLLRRMAHRLEGAIRSDDTVMSLAAPQPTAARMDADEFVVLLEGLQEAEGAHRAAERLLDVLTRPYHVGEHTVHVAVSIGVVLGPASDIGADALLQDAAIAMYEAKREGGSRYCVFEPAMRERAAQRAAVERDLHLAIDEHQLFVVYQPLVDLRTGEVAGVEALVRWRHPTHGVIPPVEFIPVAEDCGLIVPLGEFVLNEACEHFVQLEARFGEDAPNLLSVNLSRAQLLEPTLFAQVQRAIAHSGIRPQRLQLEVTESLAAQDETVRARLHELKTLGLGLALDDFGTGYSSLSSLHELPVDVVKIDRSFVTLAEESTHHRVLIQATVMVAHSLGMSTVAEGVETAGQVDVLRELGCEKGQGYLFSRPLEYADLTRWLALGTGADRPPVVSPGLHEAEPTVVSTAAMNRAASSIVPAPEATPARGRREARVGRSASGASDRRR